jgi:hypothetical protein
MDLHRYIKHHNMISATKMLLGPLISELSGFLSHGRYWSCLLMMPESIKDSSMSTVASRRALRSVSLHDRGVSASGLSISRRRASLSMVLSLWGSASAAALGPRLLSSHWAKVPLAPPDKILGLSESFKVRGC